jgi:hypothetical protein
MAVKDPAVMLRSMNHLRVRGAVLAKVVIASVVSSRPKQPGLIGPAALSSQPGRLFDQPTTQPTQPGCGPAGKCWTVVQDSDTSRA